MGKVKSKDEMLSEMREREGISEKPVEDQAEYRVKMKKQLAEDLAWDQDRAEGKPVPATKAQEKAALHSAVQNKTDIKTEVTEENKSVAVGDAEKALAAKDPDVKEADEVIAEAKDETGEAPKAKALADKIEKEAEKQSDAEAEADKKMKAEADAKAKPAKDKAAAEAKAKADAKAKAAKKSKFKGG